MHVLAKEVEPLRAMIEETDDLMGRPTTPAVAELHDDELERLIPPR